MYRSGVWVAGSVDDDPDWVSMKLLVAMASSNSTATSVALLTVGLYRCENVVVGASGDEALRQVSSIV